MHIPLTKNSDEQRYRLLVDAITDYAIYMLDAGGHVTSWNPGAQRFKGYEQGEVLGEHFSRFYTEEDRRTGLPQRALATAAGDGRFEAEGWRLRKDGSRFWAHVVIDPIRDNAGTLIGFAKITHDLAERKLAREALRRSEEQFRVLVQGVSDYAIYMLDPGGRVTSWNQGAQRIKGYLPEEILGEHFSRFYTQEDRDAGEPERALDTAARVGRFEREAVRIRKDGSRFWAHVVVVAIRDEQGTLIGFAKVTRDITERKEAQRALEEAREALFQAQKTEAIGQLTGGVAHDFNNLLMAVLGSLELLRKRLPDDDPAALRLLENAVQGARRGAALTERMLAFARRQELDMLPVDLPDLVRGMAELLQRSIGPEILIETRFPLALPPVRSDANQLETALLNLVVNARDAMPGGGRLVIAARSETLGGRHPTGLPAGPYVCLSVTDEGQGMDEETLARALDPFFTTKGVGKGTGLGLSMVHGLAEQSGGRLVLKSRLGEGTTAEIWLPVAADEPVAVAEIPEAAAEEEGTAAKIRPLRILAVDDDGLVLMSTAAMLEDLGHRVFEAASGQQALDILRREPAIDLVISDQAMPHMTGTELAKRVGSERPGLPFILATGYAELPPDADNDLPRLSKPFLQDDLVRAIRAVGEW
ncbi:hybrid sensor histidine kinase/response regulator [Lutibaculum baratangense]|uniref:histidine kinase n=1 Tax=Lutibaculum baratangense AMV1 TaxID=631454 RepID=V4TFJ3_9HYPH|nr:PAS domain-containing sensor histidine kinase [Lutibaculum baratangense]ESR24898.1 Two-component hybrid sensor and regulator [Lutibaculum baratangense AMV1]